MSLSVFLGRSPKHFFKPLMECAAGAVETAGLEVHVADTGLRTCINTTLGSAFLFSLPHLQSWSPKSPKETRHGFDSCSFFSRSFSKTLHQQPMECVARGVNIRRQEGDVLGEQPGRVYLKYFSSFCLSLLYSTSDSGVPKQRVKTSDGSGSALPPGLLSKTLGQQLHGVRCSRSLNLTADHNCS